MNIFEENLNTALADTFNIIMKYEESSLRTIFDTPVTVAEAHMIEVIAKNGSSATVSEIAAALHIAMPTATIAVKKLEKKNFVSKISCSKDGRKTIITLTEMGMRINRAHGIFHRRMVKNISRGFSETEKEVLLTAIKRLNHFFKEKIEV